MTNDRELLEAAAKAAGYNVTGSYGDGGADGFWLTLEPRPFDENTGWNPLADDGDALRLAVKLRLRIDIDDEAGTVFVSRPWNADAEAEEALFGDPYAMVRRAIVRAAAALPWGSAPDSALVPPS